MDIPHQLTATSLHPFLENILGTKFRRDRGGFRPATVFTSILKMGVLGSRSYKQTLIEMKDDLGDQLGWFDKAPSAPALSQARQQFTYEQCDDVFDAVQVACARLLNKPAHQYDEFNLYSVDMTRCNLPVSVELTEHFGIPTNRKPKLRVPQASLTMVMDVGRNRPTSWIIEDHKGSETKCAEELCAFLGPQDLLIGDRGYPSFKFFSQLIQQNTHFLIRLCTQKNGTLREVYDFLQSDKMEDVLTITRGRKNAEQTIRLRVFKQKLHDGRTAAYATNLYDNVRYTCDDLCSLYCTRWRIETAFRELKVIHAFEDMRAHHPWYLSRNHSTHGLYAFGRGVGSNGL